MILAEQPARAWSAVRRRWQREHLTAIAATGGRRHAGNPRAPAVLALLARNASRTTPCPECQSTRTKCNGVHDGLGNHVCRDCGHKYMTVRTVLTAKPDTA